VVARAIYPTNAYEPAGAFVLVNEEAVELDACGSYSPVQPTGDGVFPELVLSVQGYRFGFDDGPDYAEDVEQGARDGVCDGKVRHVFRRTGRRSVTVTAVDSAGCSSRASAVEVWVQERPVAIVEVEPSPAIAGEAVGFGARGTDGDPGDTIVGYEWVSSVAGLLSTNVVFERNDLQVGVHEIRLRVVGSDGVWSEPARAFLEVCVPQEWPVFKRTPARVSNQPGYAGRDSGQLPYGVAGDGWPFYADGAIEGSPVVADLDGDWVNGLEVAFVSRPGTLYVVDSKGFRRWSVAVGVSSSTPAIGDVNRDCRPEIVVGSRGGVRAFDARGTLLFAYAVSGGGGFEYSMPVIADVDPGVSGLEVAVTADHGGVHLIYSDGTGGTNGWPFRYGASGTEAQMFASAPAVAELEPSRYGREVVVGGMDGRLYLLDRHGSNIADFAVAGAAPIHTTPVVADVCPPVPGPEVVFGADDGVCYCVNYSNGAFTPVWQFAVSPVARIRSSPAVGMAGEGAGTQVVFGCDNGTVYLLNGTNGMQIGSYSCGAGVPVRSTPAVADIDTVRFTAPNRPEVLVAATDGVLHAINFSWGGTAVWTNRVSAMPIVGSPAVADIDHNPDLEVLVGASDNGLYVLAARPDPAQVPVVDFSGLPISGGRPLSVVFTNLTLVTNSPAMLGFWRWEFGDGSTSMDRDPVHVYELPGSYTVTLTARNAHGSRTVTKEDMVTVAPVPLADFAVSAEAGAVPLTVRFSSTARFEPSGWVWDFGDGSGSVLEHPDHTYTEPGFYTVSLTVSNGNGAETLVRSNCVLARATCPVADFTMNVTNGCAPLTVQFRDLSSAGPAGWCWDFGDGSASSERNPIHGYEAPGRYLVSLTVTNAAGANTRTGTEYLAVQPAAATGEMTLMDLGLEEGTGWIAHDASGNGNDGTIVGATWVAAELGGWALAFSGGGQWTDGDGVTVPYAPSMGAVGPFRVEAWIKASGLDHYLAIVDQYDPSATPGPSGYTLYLTGGRLRFSIYSGSAGGESGWGTTELRDDRWHRVAGVWDGEGLSAVVDGVVEGTTPWPHPPGQCEAALGIGKRLSGWGGYMPFRGAIDGVRVVQILEVEPLGVSVERSGGLAVVTWSACAVLQWAPTPMGPWADLAGAGSPVLIRVEGPCRFYRLRGLQGP
jgi:PKD repeat protein